jgi:hypothetical protein
MFVKLCKNTFHQIICTICDEHDKRKKKYRENANFNDKAQRMERE